MLQAIKIVNTSQIRNKQTMTDDRLCAEDTDIQYG